MHYKYKLNHLLSLLPAGVYPENVIAHLDLVYHIPSQIFYEDRYLVQGDETEIPYERLLIYAKVFEVSIEDLRNVNVAVI